ncbi:MAG: Hsp33 family molecular chaperone HslO [Geobacter sp.]|nr:Hsp33 family molecular chaperone HslO [Geobacter sp.]
MPVEDYLVRVMTKEGNIRALACVTTGLANDLCRRHGTSPTASAALGRALTGGALLGALLKTGQRVALKFEGNGPLRKILVEADANGAVRGCVGVPEADVPPRDGKLDVAGVLGRAGFLTVTKDLGLKEPYRGLVQLYTSEIAEDLAYYLTESEQTPSAVGLGVYVEPDGTVSAAGGFLIQSLPPADDLLIDQLMEKIGRLTSVTDLLREGKTPEDLLAQLFAGISYTTLEKRALAFQCSCSREKIERVLISLGKEELEGLMAKKEPVEITCEFCREVYRVELHELAGLLREVSVTEAGEA